MKRRGGSGRPRRPQGADAYWRARAGLLGLRAHRAGLLRDDHVRVRHGPVKFRDLGPQPQQPAAGSGQRLLRVGARRPPRRHAMNVVSRSTRRPGLLTQQHQPWLRRPHRLLLLQSGRRSLTSDRIEFLGRNERWRRRGCGRRACQTASSAAATPTRLRHARSPASGNAQVVFILGSAASERGEPC